MTILPKELQAALYAEALARAEKRLKFARADYMKEYWQRRVAYFKAAQQMLALDGGDSAASEQLSIPEVLSTLHGESTPAPHK